MVELCDRASSIGAAAAVVTRKTMKLSRNGAPAIVGLMCIITFPEEEEEEEEKSWLGEDAP